MDRLSGVKTTSNGSSFSKGKVLHCSSCPQRLDTKELHTIWDSVKRGLKWKAIASPLLKLISNLEGGTVWRGSIEKMKSREISRDNPIIRPAASKRVWTRCRSYAGEMRDLIWLIKRIRHFSSCNRFWNCRFLTRTLHTLTFRLKVKSAANFYRQINENLSIASLFSSRISRRDMCFVSSQSFKSTLVVLESHQFILFITKLVFCYPTIFSLSY